MKPGDLVRIEGDVVPVFRDSSLSNYTFIDGGEVVVVVEPSGRNGGCGVYAQVLHPTVGICFIRKQRLEAVNESR